MEVGNRILHSRFARRLLLIFLIASIVPIITLAALSLSRVSEELLEQTRAELEQSVKLFGMGIYERLRFLHDELELYTEFYGSGDNATAEEVDAVLSSRYADKLASLDWFSGANSRQQLRESLGATVSERLLASFLSNPNPSQVIAVQTGELRSRVFLSVRREGEAIESGVLVAEILPDYLWNESSLSPLETLCVLNESAITLFCSQEESQALAQQTAELVASSFSGNFEWTDTQQTNSMAAYWGIFLNNEFGIDDWSIVISRPIEEVFRPIDGFQNTFLLVFLTTLAFTLLLSFNLIQRILSPLQKLMLGIREFGNTNFENKVIVTSNDEFEDLADSFNKMGGKLAEQFKTLETMGEIDRLILSSLDADNIVQIVLARIQEIINCDFIGIIVEDGNGELNRMYVRSLNDGKKIDEVSVFLMAKDLKLINSNPQGLVIDSNSIIPEFIDNLIYRGATGALLLPLFVDEELAAVILLGYRQLPEDSHSALQESRSWSDRVSVALSNAKWQEKLYYQANYDSLTDLPNRLALKNHLEQALALAERNGTTVAILFIDMDRFKLVNDTLGHTIGDHYLIAIGERIRHSVRSTDMVARLGGDEFTIVITEGQHQQHINVPIAAVVDELLETLPVPMVIDGEEMRPSASIGIAIYPHDAGNLEDLMKNADSAMYDAKDAGGGTYRYFSEELNAAAARRLRVEAELRTAMETDQLLLYFQPQNDVQTGEIIGMETLVRWNHPRKGFLLPEEFVELAEETRLITELDNWVFEKVCDQLSEWKQKVKIDLRMAINLSGRFFKMDHFAQRVMETIEEHDLELTMFEFEITESTLIEDFEKALITVNELSDMGVHITVDDFGVGYSSLGYLKQFSVHKLKIDQSFIETCTIPGVDQALVKTIIALAGNLGLICVAEGVENREQLEFLRGEHCHAAQGYYFSKPLPAHEFFTQYLQGGT